MIEVSISKTELIIKGHAGHAEKGCDIICSAVSALTFTLIKSMESLTNSKIEYVIRSGYVNIKYKNLPEQERLLVDSFFIGICDLTEHHPTHVKIVP